MFNLSYFQNTFRIRKKVNIYWGEIEESKEESKKYHNRTTCSYNFIVCLVLADCGERIALIDTRGFQCPDVSCAESVLKGQRDGRKRELSVRRRKTRTTLKC